MCLTKVAAKVVTNTFAEVFAKALRRPLRRSRRLVESPQQIFDNHIICRIYMNIYYNWGRQRRAIKINEYLYIYIYVYIYIYIYIYYGEYINI